MNSDIILKAEDLYFSYDDEQSHSLNGLSLEIKKGQKIAFMGANGSGKSTFFLCCTGILKPQKGKLFFHNKEVTYKKKELLDLRSKIGIVFQDPDNQLFSASVYQEISFGPLNLGHSEEETKKEVEEVIDYLEITPFRHKPTHALSGGQKKQVSIADILVMKPEIIILDEPAAALDPKHTTMVNHIVDQMTQNGITVLMATHDVNYAYEWADEILLFHEGKVLMYGTPTQVFSNRGVLKQTNLEPPAVLELFESLCRKGILKSSLPLPKNLNALEKYISDVKINTHYGGTKTVSKETKKAILAVSFGTSHNDTRKITIDAIERDMQAAFPDYALYRAWTSKMIIKKVNARDGVHICNVKEAMEKMLQDGITDVLVQPTHVINGIENDLMKEDALAFQEQFHSISFGDPLLTSEQDNLAVIDAITSEFKTLTKDEVLVLMGHGTTHYANAIYAALDYTFKDKGYSNIFLGTVEAYPTMESLLKMVHAYQPKKVVLAPFMIVAGDHAKNDMASDEPDSWYSQFKAAGYDVEPVLKGLGEYTGIRKLFIEHLKTIDC
ncbi:ATP-binding cassette domain-containing protein [Lachnospiraceae bacterium AM25-11LB]|nr:ATP-binding cassette domain-containing protein [Lachnospiraceae bacterium AM25-22]RGD09075.1 ATP-binding cassette domain-containing protein [Lachnospiraceae bacterium AM25-11LB]RJW13302.1 ATP-binding cassette domain-containing protein [Lachnospiraceae bacterium AM25-40]RJW18014.1 ATP-binding cassette domain-containing protein [Lachnospiraceae bacterium AM25-39]